MSCYFRHLDQLFIEAGLNITPQNRKQVDAAIHKLMGTHYKDCPTTWREFKKQILTDDKNRKEFISRLKTELR
jgi:hypothetical protein